MFSHERLFCSGRLLAVEHISQLFVNDEDETMQTPRKLPENEELEWDNAIGALYHSPYLSPKPTVMRESSI